MDDTVRINGVLGPEASLPFLSLSGGTSGVQVLSPLLEQIAVGPTDGTVGVVVRNAAATGDAKLLLDANNQGGVAELKVLAGGNCELNAQFQFISFNNTSGLANLAIEPNIGGSNNGEVIFGYGFVNLSDRALKQNAPSEEHLVALLDLWSPQWKWWGRQRAIGTGAYERYCTLGLYAFGGNAPNVSRASSMKEACIAVNRFMRHRFPNGTWTSTAVLLNPRIGLHRDMQNMVGELNHAITLGNFTGGRVWIEDDEGISIEKISKNGTVRKLKGLWIDIPDKPRATLS
ncbi:unnamed protein product [Symbiodinium sp. CCMP2592]|nr:unnamed protein product [Symbiodinium sp. CCMP2592]